MVVVTRKKINNRKEISAIEPAFICGTFLAIALPYFKGTNLFKPLCHFGIEDTDDHTCKYNVGCKQTSSNQF
jgi:hypothetical protein